MSGGSVGMKIEINKEQWSAIHYSVGILKGFISRMPYSLDGDYTKAINTIADTLASICGTWEDDI